MAILRRLASFFFFFVARERLLLRHYFWRWWWWWSSCSRATVTNRCDWENQTVGAEPNTRCRLQTVNLLRVVNNLRLTPVPTSVRQKVKNGWEPGKTADWPRLRNVATAIRCSPNSCARLGRPSTTIQNPQLFQRSAITSYPTLRRLFPGNWQCACAEIPENLCTRTSATYGRLRPNWRRWCARNLRCLAHTK
jgi:hypothetical protein